MYVYVTLPNFTQTQLVRQVKERSIMANDVRYYLFIHDIMSTSSFVALEI